MNGAILSINNGDAPVLRRILGFIDKTALFMDKILVQSGDLTSFALESLVAALEG